MSPLEGLFAIRAQSPRYLGGSQIYQVQLTWMRWVLGTVRALALALALAPRWVSAPASAQLRAAGLVAGCRSMRSPSPIPEPVSGQGPSRTVEPCVRVDRRPRATPQSASGDAVTDRLTYLQQAGLPTLYSCSYMYKYE